VPRFAFEDCEFNYAAYAFADDSPAATPRRPSKSQKVFTLSLESSAVPIVLSGLEALPSFASVTADLTSVDDVSEMWVGLRGSCVVYLSGVTSH
jgi:hypothetical protein